MKRKLVFLPLFLIAIAAVFAFGQKSTQVSAANSPGNVTAHTPLEYPGADSVNVSNQQCLSDGSVQITVNWQSYSLGPQWIDLSLYNNGFAYGTFVGLGPVPANANSQVWGGLLPGNWHYLRVNALTQYGWYPSDTISFFTRNDCYNQQPPVYQDSDGDGVPNYIDRCPTQYGPASNSGCPVSPPPTNPGGAMCGGNWCPGQPAPANFCGVSPLIVQSRGCVWVTKGDNASYAVGEPVTVCYWVSQPMYVQVINQTPNGSNILVNGNDDGKGNCVAGNAGQPSGQRTVTLYTLNSQVLDTTTYYVQ